MNANDRMRMWAGVNVAVWCAVLLAFIGCGTSRYAQAQEELDQLYDRITEDGVITEVEGLEYVAKAHQVMQIRATEGEPINWTQTLVSAGLALIAGVPAAVKTTNTIRNKREVKMWGTPDNPKPLPEAV